MSESTSSTSSNSIISFLDPRVGKGNRDFSEREGKDKQVGELFWIEEIDICGIGTRAGQFFLEGLDTDNSVFILICPITYHIVYTLLHESQCI